MYRTLSPEYDALYQAHLEDFQAKFAETYPDPSEARFTDFYPSIGVRQGQDIDFLVYGQAVGGWHEDIDMTIQVPERRTKQSRRFSNDTYGTDSPIDWVNARWSKGILNALKDEEQKKHYAIKDSEYWASRSFFWQVTTKVIQGYYKTADENDWSWSKQLVWSNLYKIARQKENPLEDVKVLQRRNAVALVKRELDELKPRFCLVITSDQWWAPFRRGLGTTRSLEEIDGEVVQGVEGYGATKIIVIHRPFLGNSVRYADEVRKHLK